MGAFEPPFAVSVVGDEVGRVSSRFGSIGVGPASATLEISQKAIDMNSLGEIGRPQRFPRLRSLHRDHSNLTAADATTVYRQSTRSAQIVTHHEERVDRQPLGEMHGEEMERGHA